MLRKFESVQHGVLDRRYIKQKIDCEELHSMFV